MGGEKEKRKNERKKERRKKNRMISILKAFELLTACRNRKHCQKVRATHKPRKNKIYDSGIKKQLKTK